VTGRETVLAGFGIETITPDRPLPLAGVGENWVGREVLDDLHVRALYLAHEDVEIVLVSLDVLYVSRSFCCQLEHWLTQKHSVPADHLFVAATHTHCAPLLLDTSFGGLSADLKFVAEVIGKTKLAINAAIGQTMEASIEVAMAPASVSINRRARRLDRSALGRLRLKRPMANRPNFSAPVDNTVRALWLRAHSAADPDIVLVGAGCHPSILRGEMYSADFPGHIEDALNARCKRPVRAIFLQGFSGNTRAKLLETAPLAIWPAGRAFEWAFDHSRFRKDSLVSDAEWVAGMIAAAVAGARRSPPADVCLSAAVTELDLPIDARDSERKVERKVPFRIRTWAVSDQVRLLGLEGEVFSEFALWLAADDEATGTMTIPVGCVGGIAGYVPTAASLAEGGYEIDRSRDLFNLPNRFAPEIEQVLKAGIRSHLRQS